MATASVITGLDIGSTMVRVVVGQQEFQKTKGGSEEMQLQVIGVAEVPSEGVSKGVITSIDDAVSSVAACLEKAERLSGVAIEHAFVSISGTHILAQQSKGVVAVSKADGEVKEDDVERVVEAAQAVATPPNYEILHVIPRNFTVDQQTGIQDPVGMTGVRLEVEAEIIQGLSSQIKNLTKTVYRTGVDIDDLILAPLAAAEATLTKRQKEIGVVLVNMGGATTSVVVFEDGDVLTTAVLPIGGGHVTSDIAIGLRTSIELAERVKIEHGSATSESIQKKDEVRLPNPDGGEEILVSRKHIAEIIEARLEEIFELTDKELKKIGRSGLLPAGVVLTGGGAKMPGIVDVAKRVFRLPASRGVPGHVTTIVDKIHDPSMSVALGLVLWGSQLEEKKPRSVFPRFSSVDEVTTMMKKWFRSLLP